MFSYNKKKIITILIYLSFFIAIPIIKNESRQIEKKIERHEKSMNTADSSSIISTEGKNLTAAQQLKLAKITKCVPDKALQFV